MTDWLYSLEEATAALPDDAATFRFHYALRHGTMKFGLYTPKREDAQGPHKQDELYFVISGSGRFIKDGEAARFRAHDAIFVEAGSDHRFFDFTEDFATWVVFWVPKAARNDDIWHACERSDDSSASSHSRWKTYDVALGYAIPHYVEAWATSLFAHIHLAPWQVVHRAERLVREALAVC